MEGPVMSNCSEALQIVDRVAACRSMDELLDVAVGDQALSAVAATGAAVYVTDETGHVLRLERHRGMDAETIRQSAVPLDASVAVARALREGMLEPTPGRRMVPLVARGKACGVLLLVYDEARAGLAERAAARSLGSLLAMALMSLRSGDRELDLLAKFEILKNAGLAIANELAVLPENHIRTAIQRQFRLWPSVAEETPQEFLPRVLQAIVDHAKDVASAQFGALGIGNAALEPFGPWVFSGVSKEQAAAIGRHPRPVGTLGLVAHDGQVVRTPDVREHPAFRGFPPQHPEVKALLGIPIRYRGVNLGNIYLGNKVGAVSFTSEDQEMIELLASQAAISLQQAYLRAAVEVQRAQLQGILDSVPHGLAFIDAESDQVVANPAAATILGQAVAPAVGRAKYVGNILTSDLRPLRLEELPSTRALSGEEVVRQELVIRRADGGLVPVLAGAAPVRSRDGRVAGAVVTFEDITALKELERLREEFAAVVAHDFRSPINTILLQVGMLERLRVGDRMEVPWSSIERIAANANRLNQMTADLLDASRIEAARVSLEKQPIDVSEAVTGLIERLRPIFGNHAMEVMVQAPLPAVMLDQARFEQILGNLLENAAKFSPNETPIVVHLAPSDGGVLISVQDQGIGISADELPKLFDRFYQSKRARAKKVGLGLGLYISKGLVQAHGGRLWAESIPGKGSTFRVWFPGPEPAGGP
jgi:PAS domain S-box-containing protein